MELTQKLNVKLDDPQLIYDSWLMSKPGFNSYYTLKTGMSANECEQLKIWLQEHNQQYNEALKVSNYAHLLKEKGSNSAPQKTDVTVTTNNFDVMKTIDITEIDAMGTRELIPVARELNIAHKNVKKEELAQLIKQTVDAGDHAKNDIEKEENGDPVKVKPSVEEKVDEKVNGNLKTEGEYNEEAVIKSTGTKTNKIKALLDLGLKPGEIAEKLGIIKQFVYNIRGKMTKESQSDEA